MKKSLWWPTLFALALTASGPLTGCKSEEEKERDAEQSDIDSLLGQDQLTDLSKMDLTQEMSSELGNQMQDLLIEEREIESAFAERLKDWRPKEYSTGLTLSDPAKRDEFREMIEQLRADSAQYGTDQNDYWDKVHAFVKEKDGDDTPDPNVSLRFGMKALVRAFVDLADEHLAVVEHCDSHRPTIGSDGLPEFKANSDEDEYFRLAFAVEEARTRLTENATVFEQMRQSQLKKAQDMIRAERGD